MARKCCYCNAEHSQKGLIQVEGKTYHKACYLQKQRVEYFCSMDKDKNSYFRDTPINKKKRTGKYFKSLIDEINEQFEPVKAR